MNPKIEEAVKTKKNENRFRKEKKKVMRWNPKPRKAIKKITRERDVAGDFDFVFLLRDE